MLRVTIFLSLLATPLAAEPYVSDAFGILPAKALTSERAAWAGLRDGTEPVVVAPDGPDALLVFIGPKALVAGRDAGHAVALSFDRHGNLVQGVEAEFSLETNDRDRDTVRDGIAGILFQPEPQAGMFAGGVSINELQSPRALYRVTADLETVLPQIDRSAVLKSETFAAIGTAELRDRFGNLVEDGTGTTMLLDHEDGSKTLLLAPVREARAEASMLVRDIATGGITRVQLAANSADEVFEYQKPAGASSPDLQIWEMKEIGAIGLRLGPVATLAGHLLTDGSSVDISVSSGGESETVQGWLRDGYFETIMRNPGQAKTLKVTFRTALGEVTREVAVDAEAPARTRGME